jgi:hypothetical protein
MCWGRVIVASLVVLMLAACGGKLGGMNDSDLQDKVFTCNTSLTQSPGFAISCDNYRRECSRRREEGQYVC